MVANHPPPPLKSDPREAALLQSITAFFDATWYRQRYPDVVAADLDPAQHFIRHGVVEKRDPNRFFDTQWYSGRYPDVQTSGLHPLLHYLQIGAAELRDPHPAFDAKWYVGQHPEAGANPLLYHIRVGAPRRYPTVKPVLIADYLPSVIPPLTVPRKVTVDVVIPVYRGLEETKRCISSVLADIRPPLGRVIVVDDGTPESKLLEWMQQLAGENRIVLISNPRNVGFVASVNAGMQAAGNHDVVLLNSDTEVPAGWLRRLTAQAYAQPRIATVSPFSNNATICGYPDDKGGPIAFQRSLAQIDDVCHSVNTARWVDVPTTVGFCMYIRREALREAGDFDLGRFAAGYGEENDFCLRTTALGWQHRLACDVFVFHKGSVSFASRADTLAARALKLILERNPEYAHTVAHHVSVGAVTPFRFAITAAIFRESALPVILMISHNLGGGVRRHVDSLIERYAGRIHTLLLEASDRGATLSVPALPDHPVLAFPADRLDDLVLLLRSMAVSRVHIHHLAGVGMDIRSLIHQLGVPFDVTLHDYYPICPQISLLPWPDGDYCGEPDVAACNACIGARPSYGAQDILTWRGQHVWQFQDADRVLCPSEDALLRLRRNGLAHRAIVAPHESVVAGPWPQRIAAPRNGKLRIAVLGVLADHKGARTVAAVAEAMDPKVAEIHLIGHTEDNFPKTALKRLKVTGSYQDVNLQKLIARTAPHVIWFPAVWPETYSYTLSAAIESGFPIAATEIGAFTERLAGRPFTWLARGYVSPDDWIAFFDTIRATLDAVASNVPRAPLRAGIPDFYAAEYLQPRETAVPSPRRMHMSPRRVTVAVLPERNELGLPAPCAHIRLLQPLDHPAIGGDFNVVITDPRSVLHYHADIIMTQRHALPTSESADALLEHARRTGAVLIYDLDDDLLNIPANHPEAAALRSRAPIVSQMLQGSDLVWLSTQTLAQAIAPVRQGATVIPNSLDERIWIDRFAAPPFRDEPVRILVMGTSTHNRDFALIEPILVRLKENYGDRVEIDVVGVTTQTTIAPALNRKGAPPGTGQSYPGFVNWLTSAHPRWHIGLAPLLDTPFNRAKSSIKAMDYAALGLAVLASDVPAYRGSLADGPAGRLVPNDHHAWYAALDEMVRNQSLRRSIAAGARPAFLQRATLASQAPGWRRAWAALPDKAMVSSVADRTAAD